MTTTTIESYNSLFESDISFFLDLNSQKPIDRPRELISEYAEEKRVLPSGTPFPGLWRNSHTPYMVEIMDQMAPYSPAQHIRFMKCAQVGATAAAENIMAYWMDETPAPILITSATDDTVKAWMELRAEHTIDSCGFRHKIVANVNNPKSRRTGDKAMMKEYVGGFLVVASAQAASKLRSNSIRVLLRDEVDGSPAMLKTGEGNWLDVSEARTTAWGDRKKIFDFSTPTLEDSSMIYQLYLEGDKRKFHVPCPYCGYYQELKFGNEETVYGLKPIRKGGRLIEVVYICEKCHESLRNYDKMSMLPAGKWEITAEFEDKINPSYHLSGLYSPIGMLSWEHLWQMYEKAIDDPDKMRSFVNLRLGMPFKETGERPKLSSVIKLRGNYKSGTVPDGVLYLVAGVDVQAGSKKDDKNPPRLEMEVMGMGTKYRTWSIDYRRFEGSIDNVNEGAWHNMMEYINKNEMIYYNRESIPFKIELMLIDSGDGNYTHNVYDFTRYLSDTFPSKGASTAFKQKRIKGIDEIGTYHYIRYKASKIAKDLILYNIATTYYKARLYKYLGIDRNIADPQPFGFCDFPKDYSDNYFKMLTAEDHLADGSFYCPPGRRNESLDCRVMCLCAADVYLDIKLEQYREHRKLMGDTSDKLSLIKRGTIIQKIRESIENLKKSIVKH